MNDTKAIYEIQLDYNCIVKIKKFKVIKETAKTYVCSDYRTFKKSNEDKLRMVYGLEKHIFGRDKNKIFDIAKDDVKYKIKQLQEFVTENESWKEYIEKNES
jgi:hypothetical protein